MPPERQISRFQLPNHRWKLFPVNRQRTDYRYFWSLDWSSKGDASCMNSAGAWKKHGEQAVWSHSKLSQMTWASSRSPCQKEVVHRLTWLCFAVKSQTADSLKQMEPRIFQKAHAIIIRCPWFAFKVLIRIIGPDLIWCRNQRSTPRISPGPPPGKTQQKATRPNKTPTQQDLQRTNRNWRLESGHGESLGFWVDESGGGGIAWEVIYDNLCTVDVYLLYKF